MEAAACLVVAWASAAFAVRRHLFSNALSNARQPNSGPVWTFRKRTSWLTSEKHPPADAQMLPDSVSLSKPCSRRTKIIQAVSDLFSWVFLVVRPNPMLHFAPFLSTHFFPCLNPIFKNGSFLSVVALVSVTLFDSNPRTSAEKRSNLAPPPPPSRGLRQLNFPNVKNDAGQKQYSPCFLRRRRRPKAGDAFTRTRLMHTFRVSTALSVEHCRRPAMFSRKAG